jgi:hypothetical protein
MRVAVCLSGQFRSVEKCYSNIYEKIIVPNNADVFYHSWYSDDLVDKNFVSHESNKGFLIKNIHIKAFELYRPKKHYLEHQIDFSNQSSGISTHPFVMNPNSIFSMFYSIFLSNKIKSEYEKENNFIYDAVIRCRFDLKPHDIIDVSQLDLNFLNVKGDCTHNIYCLNDHFAISNSKNMDIYSDTYNFLQKYYFEKKQYFCPEILLGYGLFHEPNRKLEIKKYNWNNEIVR